MFFLTGIMLLTSVSVYHPQREETVPAYNSRNLIRLHVVANSDTVKDQDLKRRVRDAVLANTTQQLALASDVAAARQLVSQNLADISEVARLEIIRAGELYRVRAEIGDFDFPTRTYGLVTLPAGSYEAVRLVIGEGQGQNWWCVLFPPLCIVDVASNQGANDATYPVLTPKEKPNGVQARWKIVEIIKSSRQRLAEL